MGIIKRLYICDKKAACAKLSGCGKPGEEEGCHHTSDPKHAKNGAFTIDQQDGEFVVPDAVEILTNADGTIYMIEHEEERADEHGNNDAGAEEHSV